MSLLNNSELNLVGVAISAATYSPWESLSNHANSVVVFADVPRPNHATFFVDEERICRYFIQKRPGALSKMSA
jgi:hypothetical protein